MPPPRTVTCYICGRDFGSRSIGIHLPSCTKKWEQEQEKLPKKERRPIPIAPPDFDKVVKGEVKGKALAKINQKAADEFNESALETCQNCSRTFLPTALAHHRSACTEDRPMPRRAAGDSYTAQAKAKVNYPKIKNKNGKVEKVVEIVIEEETKPVLAKPPPVPAKSDSPVSGEIQQLMELEPGPISEPGSSGSSLVMISRPGSNRSSLDVEGEEEREERDDGDREEEEAREQAQFEALEKAALDEAKDEESPLKPIKTRSSLTRGPGTFRKRDTFVCKENTKNCPSRDDIINYVENEALFDQQEHRKEVFELVTNYARDVRKKQLEKVIGNKVFEDEETLEEAVNLLQDFVRLKTNNNV